MASVIDLASSSRRVIVALVVAGSLMVLMWPRGVGPVVAGALAAQVGSSAGCTMVGSPGRDELVGTSGDDVICGRGGDDHLVGRGGDDVLRGGDGDDVLGGGPGRDVASGGQGKDVVTGGVGDDSLRGGKGNDQIDARDVAGFSDLVRCGSGTTDRAFADSGSDVVSGCEVINHNEPPTIVRLQPNTVAENSPIGTLVGKLDATDPDPGDKHTFKLVQGVGAGDNALFTIDGKRLLTAAAFELGADRSLSIRVRATDIGGASHAEGLTVTVTGVTEPPTPTPTPTPTATPTPTPCTNGITITEGGGHSYVESDGGEYFVHNNNWNDNYGGTHTITACNYDNWYVDVNIPNHADNGVDAYPNVHRDYNDTPLTNITSADFAGVGPKCAGCIYNTAFDIWIGDGLSHELMIWTENFGQRPAGNQIGTTTIGGHGYQVWRSGSGDGGIFTYVSTPEQLSGNMPLNLFFADVQNRGWTPTTTWQVDFGVETVDTNGTNQRFTFTNFYIHD